MDPERQLSPAVEPPRGLHQAKVDDKGRLKLPAVVQQYLSSFGQENVFITSLDTRTARIYPISVWSENEKMFQAPTETPENDEDIGFLASLYGADSSIDGQGRVLLPSYLRRELGLENQPVWLDCYKGRINVYSESILEQRKRRAVDGAPEKLRNLEKRGFK